MYATIEELNQRITQDELIRLTDEGDIGEVDTATVTAELEAASVKIDSYLAVGDRYELPLTGPQPTLSDIAIDIAIWNLYSRDAGGVPENRKDRYREAVKTLEQIRDGKQTLGGEEKAAAGSSAAIFAGPVRLFSRNTLKDI